jgi:succinate dehydrogenase flavin-adding protein (antitoxin of CptAB toxin-antitoxin module)
MLELDVWLAQFLARVPPEETECVELLALLDADDDQIYDWLLGRAQPPARFAALIEGMRNHDAKDDRKESNPYIQP